MSDYVRKSVGANELKRALLERGLKVKALTKDPELIMRISKLWADRVTRFVPRSDLPESRHHLQTYSYSDKRIMWYRRNRAGDEIGQIIYTGDIRGGKFKFHERAEGATDYGPHEPTAYWDEMVRPGTVEWDEYVDEVTPVIVDAARKYITS